MDRDQWDERAEAVLKKLANRTWSTAWMQNDKKCISIVASAFREQAEQHEKFRRALEILSDCMPDRIFVQDNEWTSVEPEGEEYEIIDFQELLAEEPK